MTSLKERAKASVVRQRTPAESGAACLASVIRYHGGEISMDILISLTRTTQYGVTLLDLYRAAKAMGLATNAYEADVPNLKQTEEPCILHVLRDEQAEYIVCYGFDQGRFIIGDPAAGAMECSPTKMERIWKSHALLALMPQKEFPECLTQITSESLDLLENNAKVLGSTETGDADSASAGNPARRFRPFDIEALPFSSQEILVWSRRNGAARLLPALPANLVFSLEKFDDLSGHVSSLMERFERAAAGIPMERIDRKVWSDMLNELVRDGFFVSEESLRTAIARRVGELAHEEAAETYITLVGMPTANRPKSLERAVASYVEQAKHTDRKIACMVMDDSRDEATQRRNMEALHELHKRNGAHILYADRARLAVYGSSLARYASVPEEIVHFALLGPDASGPTYGAPRNALLLATAGEIYVQADDDTTANVMEISRYEDGLSLISDAESNEYRFFENSQEALQAVKPATVDLLSVHEHTLGKSVGAIITQCTQSGSEVKIDQLSGNFLERLSRPQAHVALSFTGVVGDTGMEFFQQRLFMRGETLDRLASNPGRYPRLLRSRHMLRTSARLAISDNAFCMGMHMGMDNRQLLPPFMPTGRNEDGLFGAMIRLCHPNAFKAHLPRYAVQHLPPEERRYPENGIAFRPLRANDLLVYIVLTQDGNLVGEGAQALHTLGDIFTRLTRLPIKAFSDYLRKHALQAVHTDMFRAEHLLATEPDKPDCWRNDVTHYLASARGAVTRPDFAVPIDLPGNPEERLVEFRQRVSAYGQLLIHWPALVEAAHATKNHGNTPARPIGE